MAYGVSRIFRSTDVGATQFSVTAGSLKNMLKTVLVDGYGSTASLGWTLEYESGHIAVFRMKGGTRRFIRIDDSGVTNTSYAEVSAFPSMSSINNGIGRMPVVGTNAYIYKMFSGTANIPWMVIGDDAGFYLLSKVFYSTTPTSGQGQFWQVLYFGDYNVWDLRNKWNFALICNQSIVAQSLGLYIHAPLSTVQHLVERGSSFTKGASYVGVLPFYSNTYFGHNISINYVPGIQTIGGAFMESAIHLYDNYSILGNLPGVFEPIMLVASVAYSTPADVPYQEITNSDGTLSIFLTTHASTGGTNATTTGRLIFKVGKGFRNVQ